MGNKTKESICLVLALSALVPMYGLGCASPRGGRKNKTRKRRTSAPARKKKYVRAFFFLIFF
jgi:hypothetical protein